jgi:hypothetical protein
VVSTIRPRHSVPIHASIWMPAGTLIVSVAAEKKVNETSERPTANMWCTHTPKEMIAVATVASTTNG